MQPQIPVSVNKLIQDKNGQLSTYPFPPNVAATIPKEMRKQILQWMLSNYIWPQISSRQQWEGKWDKLLDMARASLKLSDSRLDEKSRLANRLKRQKMEKNTNRGFTDLADTVIYDAVDRITNLNHFISFKERLPVQFNLPPDVVYPYENEVYGPSSRLVRSANCLLKFCADGADLYRKHWMTCKHHYIYGISYATSEYVQCIEPRMRRQPDGSYAEQLELTKFGVSFEPLSCRKLWVNTLLKPFDMDYQPCPFFFEEIPRFAIVANGYDQGMNPFGYVNLENLPKGQWLFGGNEMSAWKEAITLNNPEFSIPNVSRPELSVELKWVLYPMLPLRQVPLDQATAEKIGNYVNEPAVIDFFKSGMMWEFDFDGMKGIPLTRYITEIFGTSLMGGDVEFIRIQESFYPNGQIPIFGSAHMPDLDSGQYSPAIGDILENHYVQITKALCQFLDNKDIINDPPHKMQLNSPSLDSDLNVPGAKNVVNSMNDYEQHQIIDGTQTTPAFIQAAREQAQTSSKAVDGVLGKAMGSRTTAREASNVYEAAMAGVTTDINLFNHDIAGGYASRVWSYIGEWTDPDVIAEITGQYGFAIKPQHFNIRMDVTWDIGSAYVESMTRQDNIRYLLESTVGDPSVNRPYLLRALLKEWRFKDINQIINDGGMEQQILEACNQAEQTYMNGAESLQLIDPEQNHEIAKRVKVSYLKDRTSVWNTRPDFAINAKYLVEQIQLHEMYRMMQLYQQMAQMHGQLGSEGKGSQPPMPMPPPMPGQPLPMMQ